MVWIAVLIGIAVLLLVFVAISLRRRKLSATERQKIDLLWKEMMQHDDPLRRIMVSDAILDRALTMSGYTGSVGEKLKMMGSRLPHLNDVWRAHKLRNKIAHEPGTKVSEKDAEFVLKTFRKAIDSL